MALSLTRQRRWPWSRLGWSEFDLTITRHFRSPALESEQHEQAGPVSTSWMYHLSHESTRAESDRLAEVRTRLLTRALCLELL